MQSVNVGNFYVLNLNGTIVPKMCNRLLNTSDKLVTFTSSKGENKVDIDYELGCPSDGFVPCKIIKQNKSKIYVEIYNPILIEEVTDDFYTIKTYSLGNNVLGVCYVPAKQLFRFEKINNEMTFETHYMENIPY